MEYLCEEIIKFVGDVSFPDRSVCRKRCMFEHFRLFIIGSLARNHYVNHTFNDISNFDPNHTDIPMEWIEKIVCEATSMGWDAKIHNTGTNTNYYTLKIYQNP